MSESDIGSRLAQGMSEHRQEVLRAWERAIIRELKPLPLGASEIPCLLDGYLKEVCIRLGNRDYPEEARTDPLTPFDRISLFLVGEEAIAEKLEHICGNPSTMQLLALRRELNEIFSEMIRRHSV